MHGLVNKHVSFRPAEDDVCVQLDGVVACDMILLLVLVCWCIMTVFLCNLCMQMRPLHVRYRCPFAPRTYPTVVSVFFSSVACHDQIVEVVETRMLIGECSFHDLEST